MPLARISALDAAKNLRRRHSLWPDGRVPTDRLDGLAKVVIDNRFTFSRADRIMTIGSCFAREIEKRLDAFGFDLPMLKLALPREERASSIPNDFINKYTIQSIVNEFRWALGVEAPPLPEQLFLELDEDLWHDPQLIHNMEPAPLERLIERRALVQAALGALPECRIVVVTLGLAEAWFDHLTGLHLNGAPPNPAVRRDPGRFSLDLLAYEDVLEGLETLHGLLRDHGHPDVRLLVTVSPVPFKATFTGVDALQANTYSKAVQRAAVEAFVRRHEDVDYFPSYEIVTLSNRELAYERDNIHVTAAVVRQITDQVLQRYCPDLEVAPEPVAAPPSLRPAAPATKANLQRNAKFLVAERKYAEACEAYDQVLATSEPMSDRERGQLHLDFGVALLRCDRNIDGVVQLRKACALLPLSDRAAFKLGLGLGRLKQVEASVEALRRATELAPSTAHYFSRLGLGLRFAGREVEALDAYRQAIALDPANPEAQAALEKAAATVAA